MNCESCHKPRERGYVVNFPDTIDGAYVVCRSCAEAAQECPGVQVFEIGARRGDLEGELL